MAAGKSAAAAALAERLGLEARDSDAEVEAAAGEPIAEVFESEGEAGFREREERAGARPARSRRRRGRPRRRRAREREGARGAGWPPGRLVRRRRGDRLGAGEPGRRAPAGERPRGVLAALRRAPAPLRVGRQGGPARRRRARPRRPPRPGSPRCARRPACAWSGPSRLRAPTRPSSGPAPPGSLDAVRASHPGEVPERSFRIVDRRGRGAPSRADAGARDVDRGRGTASVKTMAEAERVLRELAKAGARRDDLVLAVGGGVVGDLAGLLRRHLPARRPGGAGPDDAGRPGGLRLRRQDRGGPARGARTTSAPTTSRWPCWPIPRCCAPSPPRRWRPGSPRS